MKGFAEAARLVEHRLDKPKAEGSIPSLRTMIQVGGSRESTGA